METTLPLTSIFGSPEAAILDQSLIVGNMEQSIPMLSESTDLSEREVETVVRKLVAIGLIRKVGVKNGEVVYSFKVDTTLKGLIDYATKFQFSQLP